MLRESAEHSRQNGRQTRYNIHGIMNKWTRALYYGGLAPYLYSRSGATCECGTTHSSMRAHPPVSHSDTYIGVSVGHLSQHTAERMTSTYSRFVSPPTLSNLLPFDWEYDGLSLIWALNISYMPSIYAGIQCHAFLCVYMRLICDAFCEIMYKSISFIISRNTWKFSLQTWNVNFNWCTARIV